MKLLPQSTSRTLDDDHTAFLTFKSAFFTIKTVFPSTNDRLRFTTPAAPAVLLVPELPDLFVAFSEVLDFAQRLVQALVQALVQVLVQALVGVLVGVLVKGLFQGCRRRLVRE